MGQINGFRQMSCMKYELLITSRCVSGVNGISAGSVFLLSFPCPCLQMSKQLDTFKTNLEEFASKHKQEIRKNPQFRVQFQDMCATIGVDPLACKE